MRDAIADRGTVALELSDGHGTCLAHLPDVNTFTCKGYALLKLHRTVKPVRLIADAIRDRSHRKGIVLDPFSANDTILIAAESTDWRAREIELDPARQPLPESLEPHRGRATRPRCTDRTGQQVLRDLPAGSEPGPRATGRPTGSPPHNASGSRR